MLKSLSLNLKMFLMFGFASVMLLTVGCLGITSLNNVSDDYEHVTKINLPNTIAVESMKAEGREVLRFLTQSALPTDDREETVRLIEKMEASRAAFADWDKKYRELEFVDGEEPLYAELNERWENVSAFVDKLKPLVLSENPEDHATFVRLFREDFSPIRADFYKSVDVLIQFQHQEAERWVKLAERTAFREEEEMITLVALGFILFMVI
jgi:hypothetical protein